MTSRSPSRHPGIRQPARLARALALLAAMSAAQTGMAADADGTPPVPPSAALETAGSGPEPAVESGGQEQPTVPTEGPAGSAQVDDATGGQAPAGPDAVLAPVAESPAEDHACDVQTPVLIPREESGDGASWARDWLFRSVCRSAQWFDSFFGEERFDDAASKMRGNAFLIAENRQGHSLEWKPGLRVRVSLPNVSRRFDVFFDRDEEQNTIEGRGDPTSTPAVTRPTGTSAAQESTQLGIAYRLIQELDELLNFRIGVRARSGSLRPFAQGRYRHDFLKTEVSQWVFTETLFWRKPDGFGETTALDYETALGRSLFFRWFNNATYSEITNGFAWQSGVNLYKDLGEARAVQLQLAWAGETGALVDVANYGVRLSYRQTIGRPWLFGEIFTGLDRPRSDTDIQRRDEAFIGLRTEIHFGKN